MVTNYNPIDTNFHCLKRYQQFGLFSYSYLITYHRIKKHQHHHIAIGVGCQNFPNLVAERRIENSYNTQQTESTCQISVVVFSCTKTASYLPPNRINTG